MRGLEALLAEPLMAAAGWTLLHFLWQGALVAALVAVARPALRHASAHVRYLVGCAALLVLLLLPVGTFAWLASTGVTHFDVALGADEHLREAYPAMPRDLHVKATVAVSAGSRLGVVAGSMGEGSFESFRLRAAAVLQPALPWLVLVWLVGVLLLSLRLVGGWSVARRLRHTRTAPVAREWEETVARLRQRLRVSRPVVILESACVAVPTVIGCLRPAILLPLSALTGLSRDGLEAVLAHELAHIRRHDFLVNLIQSMVETLLFYHPAVWWISSWVRIEREHCCDDLAMEVCGNPLCYAHALTDLETWRSSPRQLAVAATGGVLLARIRRLLGVPSADAYPSSWPLAGALVLVLGALGLGVAGVTRPDAVAGDVMPKMEEAKPETGEAPGPKGWAAIQKGGRVLKLAVGRAVRIDGVGRIKLNTKTGEVVMPEDHRILVNGQPADERTFVRDEDVVQSSDPTQESFWEVRLDPAAKPALGDGEATEPNLVGEFGLEVAWPTRINLEVSADPYGAYFSSVPIKSQVVLGVVFEPIEATLADQIGIKPTDASLIGHVVEGLPACNAGVHAGDVIVAVGGRPPGSQERINREMVRRKPGDPLELGLLRDGQHVNATVLVGSRELHGAALAAADAAYERSKAARPK